MAEIHINQDDLRFIIESYSKEDETFLLKSFVKLNNKITCKFFLSKADCTINLFLKKNSVKIMPIGKNIDISKRLIEYIESKGFSAKTQTNQFVFPCADTIIKRLVEYTDNECQGIIRLEQNGNTYKFIGYNGDTLTFNFYPQSNKAMIQGRPFHAYSIVVSFLSELPDFTLDQIIEINNGFVNMNTPISAIREIMEVKLGKAYDYLDEALLKSISGSLTLLRQTAKCEDYTGCVTGIFKALEGFLKKLLAQKYSYKLVKSNTFRMFYRQKGGPSQIDQDSKIPSDAKSHLNNLYSIYSNKRNVYLHSTINPSQTRIIPTLKEADDLASDILFAITDSYATFSNKN